MVYELRSKSQKANMNDELIATVKSMQDNISKMNDSIVALTNEVVGLKSEKGKLSDIKTSLEFTQSELKISKQDIGDLKMKSTSLREDQSAIVSQLLAIQRENHEVKERLLKLETYTRRENLKLSGLIEPNNETGDQCRKSVVAFFQDQLEITNAANIEFQRVHRLGKRVPGKDREVIVRFVRFGDRENVWSRKKKLKGTSYIIKEDFPAEIESRRSQLFPIYKAALTQKKKAALIVDNLFIDGKKYTTSSLDSLSPELQPKSLATKQIGNTIIFHGMNSVFSNFFSCNFELDGTKYSSSEQYFQNKKAIAAGLPDTAQRIMSTDKAVEIYRMGKKLGLDTAGWNNETGKAIMLEGIEAKFGQNPLLRKELLDTGNNMIVECNKHDRFWSNGLSLHDLNVANKDKWKGNNELGNILIKVRENLK
jgi:ribA/ribD-fused uncharacterized protein